MDSGLWLLYTLIYTCCNLDEFMLIQKQMEQTNRCRKVTFHHIGETQGLKTKRHLPKYVSGPIIHYQDKLFSLQKMYPVSGRNKPAKNIFDRTTTIRIGFHHNINHIAIWKELNHNKRRKKRNSMKST